MSGIIAVRVPLPPSVAPEIAEPIQRQLGIADGMLDALVAQVVFKSPSVAPIIGQLVPAGVAEHVRVHRKREPGRLAVHARDR